jgi:FKBP-type peptidyl-prolyl cis-trans isomerase
MKKGIELESEIEGSGPVAQRGCTVTIRYSGYLHRCDAFQKQMTYTFKLGKREVIAGLDYAVEGMKVGGRRSVKVGPHLAYRTTGVPGSIPPNALLVFEIDWSLSKAGDLSR